MKNAKQSGHILSVSRSPVSVSGLPYDLGDGLVGVAFADYIANEEGEFATSGVKEFDKEGSAYTIGESVGWDDGNNEVVKSIDGAKDFDLGTVTEVAAGGDAKIQVMVNGIPGPGPSFK